MHKQKYIDISEFKFLEDDHYAGFFLILNKYRVIKYISH